MFFQKLKSKNDKQEKKGIIFILAPIKKDDCLFCVFVLFFRWFVLFLSQTSCVVVQTTQTTNWNKSNQHKNLIFFSATQKKGKENTQTDQKKKLKFFGQ